MRLRKIGATSVKEAISADDGERAAKSIQVARHTIRRRGELQFLEDLAGESRAARPHHWQTEARFLA